MLDPIVDVRDPFQAGNARKKPPRTTKDYLYKNIERAALPFNYFFEYFQKWLSHVNVLARTLSSTTLQISFPPL